MQCDDSLRNRIDREKVVVVAMNSLLCNLSMKRIQAFEVWNQVYMKGVIH